MAAQSPRCNCTLCRLGKAVTEAIDAVPSDHFEQAEVLGELLASIMVLSGEEGSDVMEAFAVGSRRVFNEVYGVETEQPSRSVH